MKYFIKSNGKIYGPAEENKIAEKIADGFFASNCLVSSDKENWQPLPTSINSAVEDLEQPRVEPDLTESQDTSAAMPPPRLVRPDASDADSDLESTKPLGIREKIRRFFGGGDAKSKKLKWAFIIPGIIMGIALITTLVVVFVYPFGKSDPHGKKATKAAHVGPKTKNFVEVCAHYQQAVGVVVVTLEDSDGKLLTHIGKIPVKCDQTIGTAFAIGDNVFVTNCHVAYAVKDQKNDVLDDILLRAWIAEAKRLGVKPEEFSAFCKKNEKAIESDRKFLQENIRVRKVEIRLAHSDGMTLPVTGVQIHPRYKTAPSTVEDDRHNPEFDLAIFHTEKNAPTYFNIADTDVLYNLHQGQRIAYLGFPMENLVDDGGLNLERPEATFKSGTINKITDFDNVHSAPRNNRSLTHDIPTVGGASGSPVFLENGEVVAVVWGASAKRDSQGGRVVSAAQHNFAVRIDSLDAVKEEKVHDINDWLGEKKK